MCDPFDLNACNFPHGTCAEDGFCNCEVGYFGDYCMFPEICDDEPGRSWLTRVGYFYKPSSSSLARVKRAKKLEILSFQNISDKPLYISWKKRGQIPNATGSLTLKCPKVNGSEG